MSIFLVILSFSCGLLSLYTLFKNNATYEVRISIMQQYGIDRFHKLPSYWVMLYLFPFRWSEEAWIQYLRKKELAK